MSDFNIAKNPFTGEPFYTPPMSTDDRSFRQDDDLFGAGARSLKDGAADVITDEDCESQLSDLADDCSNQIAALTDIIDDLEDLVTPTEDPDGNGQWQLITPVSHGCRFGVSKVSCAHTDRLSVAYDSGSSNFKFTRINSVGCAVIDGGVRVEAPGGVDFEVNSALDFSATPLTLSLNGDRGTTSTDNLALSDGTYYVRARATNIFKPDCSGFYSAFSWQNLGSFTVSGVSVDRLFNVIVEVEGND